ncbi:hypothetical protein [Jeongeupia chitinilytica]|uniref:Transmembrane protein n=1 Tax=Jeongeupia chitinilytica TaxID=1041641 RepID=A0ABQ3H1Q1_9NEIS|nr:hypothetical protein [Jeongeupia chitinilytica]GHD60569.1 hypothetical protein GCM10007350_13810 [Jeongeupia chitinilytica]
MTPQTWNRIGIVVAGLAFGYIFYGIGLVMIGLGHMNPRPPRYFRELSWTLQVLPLSASAIGWLCWLFTSKRKWLWLAVLAAAWVALSIPALQAALPYLPPGPYRE